jgi:outer membrane protein assembly factor BamB
MRRVFVAVVVVALAFLGRAQVGVTADSGNGPWSVAAVNVATGARLWAKPVTAEFAVFSGMTLRNGVLYGQWGRCAHTGGPDVGVAAIDAKSGRVKWTTPALVAGETAQSRLGVPLSAGVYVLNGEPGSPTLVGIDAVAGSTRWQRHDTTTGVFYEAFVGSRLVTVRSGATKLSRGTIEAFDAQTGKTVWTRPLPAGAFPAGLAADSDHVVVGVMDTDAATGRAVAFDARTGAPRWSADGRVSQILGAANGIVAAATPGQGSIVGLDVSTGAE